MATDLFNKYYTNPDKSYLYTNMTCNGDSADEMSFDISGDSGVISDSDETLASLDLEGVHVPLTQYKTGMRTIEPYTFIYIKGFEGISAYTKHVFDNIPEEVTSVEDWVEKVSLVFSVKYIGTDGVLSYVDVDEKATSEYSLVEKIQKFFDDNKILINIDITDNILTFTASAFNFSFWIDTVKIVLNSKEFLLTSGNITAGNIVIDSSTYTVAENGYKEVPTIKYKNGAMKGCVIVATYPTFDADDIPETQHSLRLAYLRDTVTEYFQIPNATVDGNPVFKRVVNEVEDSYFSKDELEIFRKWSNETLELIGNKIRKKTKPDVPDTVTEYQDHIIGLNGYLNYVSERGEWIPMGQVYIHSTVNDDVTTNSNNMLNSFCIYNPNSFPVIVKYMIYA